MAIETFNNVAVSYTLYPRKNRKKSLDIYYRFEFSLNGAKLTNKRISVSIGVECEEKDWAGEKVKGTGAYAISKNKEIERATNIIYTNLQRLKAAGPLDLSAIIKEIEIGIKPQITGKASTKEVYKDDLSTLQDHTIEEVKEKYITNYNKFTERQMSANTVLKYDITIRYLKAFWLERYKQSEVLISNIDIKDMDEYKSFLLRQPKNKIDPEAGTLDPDTARTYLSKMRAIFKFAAKPTQEGGLGLIKHIPIREKLIGAFDDSDRDPLSLEEIKAIWRLNDADLTAPLIRVKYLFLFMGGSGTGFTEVKSLKPDHFEVAEDGLVFLTKGRTKNNKKFGVTLLPFAVDAYLWFKQQAGFFDIVTSETNERLYLRDLGVLAGIKNENLTLYVGRSTFITNLLAEGVDKWHVKDMVGHANLSMLNKYDKAVAKIKAKAHKQLYDKTNIGTITKD